MGNLLNDNGKGRNLHFRILTREISEIKHPLSLISFEKIILCQISFKYIKF